MTPDEQWNRGLMTAEEYREETGRWPVEYELELAIVDRLQLGVVGFGPLTRDEHERVESYERYCIEMEREHEEQMAAGGRTICPQCGERSVTHRGVVTLGYAGHPGAEYSDLAECERCEYKEI